MFNAEKCVGCGACLDSCAEGAISLGPDGRARVDRRLCADRGDCVVRCHHKAREMSGRLWSARALLDEVAKDRVVFRNSGGGVTLSGGEPLLDPGFAGELLLGCRRQGIHTAVETCGAVPWGSFEQVLPQVDLFLFDIKLIDSAKHELWTGATNSLVLENAARLAQTGKRMFVRVPLVPGVNDSEADFGAIAAFAADRLKVGELHILPFHQIGSSKYDLVGREYLMRDVAEDNAEGIARCRRIAEGRGLRVSVGGTGFRGEADSRRIAQDSSKTRKTFLYDL
jgi:pyruvate formate lyase activating enzyme